MENNTLDAPDIKKALPIASFGSLFWNGQSFEEPKLEVEGTFKAAQVRNTDKKQIQIKNLKRWLKQARLIQWDYKNIVKRKGRLVRLQQSKPKKH